MLLQRARRLRTEVEAPLLILNAELPQEGLRQEKDVRGPLAQRRQLDGNDREPIVEVLPKLVFDHGVLQIHVRRRNHPCVDLDLGPPSHSLNGLLLQETEQFDLKQEWEFANFIEEQRAVAR